MSAPKPGDRVRVTYEGVWANDRVHMPGIRGLVEQVGDSGTRHDFPAYAKVEVLPKPVYVNHDTTEYRNGDVVRSAGGGIYIYSSTRCHGWMDPDGRRTEDDDLPGPLLLLVRDGQVVTS